MSGVVAMCGACLTWIEPRGDRCHHCGELFSLYSDDPLDRDVAERLGEPLADLGPVVLNRPRLPVAGRLYGTTTGWVFRPVFTLDESGALSQFPIPRRDRSWLWRFVPSSATSGKARADLAECIGQKAVDSAEQPFAELYLAAPGGLFVPIAWIQKIRRQRSVLRVWYHQVQRVEFELLASEKVVDDALNKLDEHDAWRAILS